MNLMYNSRLFRFTGLLLGVLVWLANANNPPTGKTGAPFNGHCNECHTGNPNGFDGTVTIDGMPATVDPNTTYPLTITLTPTAGTPVRGGFQLVAVNGNNANAGDLTAGNAQSGTEFLSGREYLEHRGAKVFTGGGPASWTFNWKSPVTAAGNIIHFYFIGNFTNGNNNDTGDFPIAFSESYAFNGAPPVTATIASTTNVSCSGGNNGSATVEADGGIPPYTYQWSNNQTTQTATNLVAGTYTVTVTGSSGTGTATATAVITQPSVLNASATAQGTITCNNPSVTATVSASGGTQPYSYEWDNGDNNSQTQLTTPGGHSVTVTDDNGCTKVAFVTVNSNTTAPTAVAGPGASLTCAAPTATLNGSGSSTGANFTYQWIASAGGNIVSGGNTLTPVVNAAGTYTLQVTNSSNGCTSTASTTATSNIQLPTANTTGGILNCTTTATPITVNTNASNPTFSWIGPGGFTSTLQSPSVNTPGTYTVTVTNTATGCTNTGTASVTQNTTPPTITASGGTLNCLVTSITLNSTTNATGPTFLWAGPNNYSSTQQNPVVNVPGTYTVTVTNAVNGCTASATATINQNITPPTANATAGQITCANTTASLNVTTNASDPGFSWSGPNGYSSTLQNPTTTVAGTYTVVVLDSVNGCTATGMATVNLNTTLPTASAFAPGNLNCNTTSIQLNGTASSQGPNFTYLWTTSNGNIVNGATTLTPTVNAVGAYTLLVTNTSNGCTSTTTVTVIQSPPVTASIGNVVNVSCNGGANGSATAAGGGGSGTFTYLWSTNATTAAISNLPAGTYIVTATDSENCTATASVTVTQPPVLSVNASATPESSAGASDGTASAAPAGGTPGYTYLWSNNATTAAITNLAPGNYTVSVTDANNCTAVQTVTVNSFNCTISATTSVTHVTCNGANNGTATANVSGGALPITYVWSNGDTTAMATGLAPGMYTVEILDANNCPLELSVTITQPAPLSANATATNQTAVGMNDGTATAQPTGGTPAYTYLWSNNATTQTITGLAPGQYTVSVTDANNCTAVQTVVVSPFNCNLGMSISTVNVLCAGGNNGQATAIPTGANLPVEYLWSTSATTATISGLVAGGYSVTVTDNLGCIATATATILQPAPLETSVSNVMHVECPENTNGSAMVSASGGTQPYQITWPNASNGQNLTAGTYSVSVVDANGCTAIQSVTITATDNLPPGIVCPTVIPVPCPGVPLQYDMPAVSDNCSLNGAQAILISGLPSGSVFPVGESVQVFRVTDASGNSSTCSFSVQVEAPVEVMLDNFTNDVNNTGVGTINVTVSGPTAGITYQWTKDGQNFANTEDLTGLMAGVYRLIVTQPNGCTVALPAVTIDNTVAANEPDIQPAATIYPNPAKNTLRLETGQAILSAVHILDIHGRLIRVVQPSEWTSDIDVSNLSGGLFGLRIWTTDGQMQVIKWVKAD